MFGLALLRMDMKLQAFQNGCTSSLWNGSPGRESDKVSSCFITALFPVPGMGHLKQESWRLNGMTSTDEGKWTLVK